LREKKRALVFNHPQIRVLVIRCNFSSYCTSIYHNPSNCQETPSPHQRQPCPNVPVHKIPAYHSITSRRCGLLMNHLVRIALASRPRIRNRLAPYLVPSSHAKVSVLYIKSQQTTSWTSEGLFFFHLSIAGQHKLRQSLSNISYTDEHHTTVAPSHILAIEN